MVKFKLFKKKDKKDKVTKRDAKLLEKYEAGEVIHINDKIENKKYRIEPNFPKR